MRTSPKGGGTSSEDSTIDGKINETAAEQDMSSEHKSILCSSTQLSDSLGALAALNTMSNFRELKYAQK